MYIYIYMYTPTAMTRAAETNKTTQAKASGAKQIHKQQHKQHMGRG